MNLLLCTVHIELLAEIASACNLLTQLLSIIKICRLPSEVLPAKQTSKTK